MLELNHLAFSVEEGAGQKDQGKTALKLLHHLIRTNNQMTL